MRYLETEGKGARIESLIKESITAFLSIFHALLYLKGAGIPQGRKDVVRVLEKVFTFNANVFIECIDIKEGRRRVAVRELESIIHAYLKELVSLAHQVNGMKI
jgi:hypothetical protein